MGLRVQSERGGSDSGGEDGLHSGRIDGGIIKVFKVILATVIIVTFTSGRSHCTARMICVPPHAVLSPMIMATLS